MAENYRIIFSITCLCSKNYTRQRNSWGSYALTSFVNTYLVVFSKSNYIIESSYVLIWSYKLPNLIVFFVHLLSLWRGRITYWECFPSDGVDYKPILNSLVSFILEIEKLLESRRERKKISLVKGGGRIE